MRNDHRRLYINHFCISHNFEKDLLEKMSNVFMKRVTGEIQKMKKELPMQCIGFYVDEVKMQDFYFLCVLDEEPFKGGEYIVHIQVSNGYPFKAPVYRMLTPNGRFEADKTICNDFSHYHQNTYPATVSLSTLVTMLVRHLQSDDPGIGAIKTSFEHKQILAKKSVEYNKTVMKRIGIDEWLTPVK